MIQKIIDALKNGHAYITDYTVNMESEEVRSFGSPVVEHIPTETTVRFSGEFTHPMTTASNMSFYPVGEKGQENMTVVPSLTPSSWVECGHCRAGYERIENPTCPRCGAPYEGKE